MKNTSYWGELTAAIGSAWNRFWFTPADPFSLGVLRIVVGLAGLYYVLSFTGDLEFWFGPEGVLPTRAMVDSATSTGTEPGLLSSGRIHPGTTANRPTFHLSYFYYFTSPQAMNAAHYAGAAIMLLFALGVKTRFTGPLAWLVALAYFHRAPMIASQFDVLVVVCLLYVGLGPSGVCLSVDRLLRGSYRSRAEREAREFVSLDSPSLAANLALRLLQVHVAALYLAVACGHWGNDRWTGGDALWLLMARVDSQLFDPTFLLNYEYLLNVWTLAVAVFELAFGLFIWNRLARPLLLIASLLVWPSLAFATGLVAYCLLMMALGLAFLPAATLRRGCGCVSDYTPPPSAKGKA